MTIQEKVLFHPIKEYFAPIESFKNKLNVGTFSNSNGDDIVYWHIKGNKPPILYCAGQRANMSYFQERVKFLANRGHELFLFDYPGYGKSAGKPSEKAMYTTAKDFVETLANEHGINRENLMLWGHSLGGAVAVELASQMPFKKVIIEGSFTNVNTVARKHAPYWKTSKGGIAKGFKLFKKKLFFNLIPITQKFNSLKKVDKIKSPVLFLHSKEDAKIPAYMSRELFEKAKTTNPNTALHLNKTGHHLYGNWHEKPILDFIEMGVTVALN